MKNGVNRALAAEKDFWKSWKFWVAVFAVLVAIVGLILYFTVPAFKDVLLNIAIGIGGIDKRAGQEEKVDPDRFGESAVQHTNF